MAFDSFGEFVKRLEAAGQLKRIAEPLATELAITEVADREMKKPGGGLALLIEKPTVNGEVSRFPLAINTFGSNKRMAMSIGAESVDQAAAELSALINAKPPTSAREAVRLLASAFSLRHAKPRMVRTGPCKESIHKFEPAPTRIEPWPPAPSL